MALVASLHPFGYSRFEPWTAATRLAERRASDRIATHRLFNFNDNRRSAKHERFKRLLHNFKGKGLNPKKSGELMSAAQGSLTLVTLTLGWRVLVSHEPNI